MDVALAQDEVVVAADLDLVAVLGVEQHLVADLDGAHVRADGDDLGPRQPLGHLRGGRDEDAARRAPLALLAGDLHQEPVVQHLDRQLVVRRRHGRRRYRLEGSDRTHGDAGRGHQRLGLGDRVLAEVEDRGRQHGVGAALDARRRPGARACRRRRWRSPGRRRASATARVSSRSKPSRVPSRSIDVSRISPAPSALGLARPTRPRRCPVGVRPPWMYDLPAGRRRRAAGRRWRTTTHCAPNSSAISAISSGRCDRRGVDAHLVGARPAAAGGRRRRVRMPPPTVNGMNTSSAVRRPRRRPSCRGRRTTR